MSESPRTPLDDDPVNMKETEPKEAASPGDSGPTIVSVERVGWGVYLDGEMVVSQTGKQDAIKAAQTVAEAAAGDDDKVEIHIYDGQGRVTQKRYVG